ncbi:MAG: right-handed parallel beta-helix repeat-containing protein [Planctomycetota bacterium]
MNKRLILVASVALASGAALVVLGGDLDPPAGAVAPTMKTLADVEPRGAIRNDFVTITPIVINASGSYYLAEDILSLPNQHGVEITADNVTLDLNGYTIRGNTEVGSLDGVHIAAGVDNVTIRNGTIQFFGGDGVGGSASGDARLGQLRLIFNADDGVDIGERAIVTDCTAIDNGDIGIRTSEGARLSRCIAENNGTWGVLVGFYSETRDCLARDNTTGFSLGFGSTAQSCASSNNTGAGFSFAFNCTAHQCTASSNGSTGIFAQRGIVTDSLVTSNDGAGVLLADGGLLRDSVVRSNGVNGVGGGSRCYISGCVITGNTGDGIDLAGDNNVVMGCDLGSNTGVGIRVPGDQNRISENHSLDTILVQGVDNLIVKNSATVSAAVGNQAAINSTDPDTAGPWSNFTP